MIEQYINELISIYQLKNGCSDYQVLENSDDWPDDYQDMLKALPEASIRCVLDDGKITMFAVSQVPGKANLFYALISMGDVRFRSQWVRNAADDWECISYESNAGLESKL